MDRRVLIPFTVTLLAALILAGPVFTGRADAHGGCSVPVPPQPFKNSSGLIKSSGEYNCDYNHAKIWIFLQLQKWNAGAARWDIYGSTGPFYKSSAKHIDNTMFGVCERGWFRTYVHGYAHNQDGEYMHPDEKLSAAREITSC